MQRRSRAERRRGQRERGEAFVVHQFDMRWDVLDRVEPDWNPAACRGEPGATHPLTEDVKRLGFEQLSEEEAMAMLRKGEITFHRAGGDCICEACGKEYWRHPMDMEHIGWNDEPYLNKLCDGRLVKL